MKDHSMRILHVISSWKGGETRVAFDISEELIRRGHAVTIYATNLLKENEDLRGKKVTTVTNFDVLFSPIAKKMKLYVTPQLILALKEVKHFDIIHFHGYRTFQNIILHHYAKKRNIPYILQAHGSLPRIASWQKLKWIYDASFGYKLLRDASKVIALSRVEAEQYRRMGIPEEKIAIIPNGIDLSGYANLPPKGCFKRKFGIPEEKKIILYLGRIHKTKGIDFLIKAYAHLINKMGVKDAVLVIAGPDDGYLGEAKNLAQSLGISSFLIFTGSLSEQDKITAYVDSNVVVNVEPLNVYGLVPLEAAACSMPVVVSKTNAISEIVMRGGFGFAVNYGDIASLSSILHRVLKDEGLAEDLGRNGRKYVFRHLSWSKIIKEFERIYEEVSG